MLNDARIGIVTSFLGNLRAGTWVYTRNLLQGLAGRGIVRIDREKRSLGGVEAVPDLIIPGGRSLAKFTWPNFQLPEGAMRSGLDLVHFTTPYGSFRHTGFKKVITICDVTPLLFPGAHGRMNVVHHRWILPSILRCADHIITISEASKRDIVRLYRIAEEKITVTLLAADPSYRPLSPGGGGYLVTALPRPYILNVGTLEPRKNLEGLLRAFARAKKKGIPHTLVITGASGWGESGLAQLPAELGIADSVLFTGFVADEALPHLYANADFFVYPSLYEGFGLPVLEAMACGTPVIASNTSSIPEVAGDAGILVDPCSEGELAAAMMRLAGDDQLRNDLKKRGINRAAGFSWEKTAQETFAVYGKVLA